MSSRSNACHAPVRLIVNGRVAGTPALREAVHAWRQRGRSVEVRVTWERGDATRLALEAMQEGVGRLVACGGDGTLGAVAGVLAAHADDGVQLPDLAVLPMGTANDFATAAAVPADIGDALSLALTAGPRPVDMLRVVADGAEHWCINMITGGFGTDATVDAGDGLKRLLGELSYVVRGLAQLPGIRSERIELHGPGFEWAGEMIVLAFGNSRQAGGGQVLCPDAKLDDGLLDLAVVPELAGEVAATLATVVTEGRVAALERVAHAARLPWVVLRSPSTIRLNLDGEPLDVREVRIDCLPGRVRMRLPERCPLVSRPPVHAAAAEKATDRRLGAPDPL